jgi:hypothetical protein
VDTLRATFQGRQVDIRRPMTLTPEERHEYIFTYYLWKFDGRQAVYHALSIDDVRLWNPLTNTWVRGISMEGGWNLDGGCATGRSVLAAGRQPGE